MATKPDDLLPKASDFMKKLALTEAEEPLAFPKRPWSLVLSVIQDASPGMQ
jgi:hypothetical protein